MIADIYQMCCNATICPYLSLPGCRMQLGVTGVWHMGVVQHSAPLPLYVEGCWRIAQQCEHQKAALLLFSQSQLARFRAQRLCSFKSDEKACVDVCVCEPLTLQAVYSEIQCCWHHCCSGEIEKLHHFTGFKMIDNGGGGGGRSFIVCKATLPLTSAAVFKLLCVCTGVSSCLFSLKSWCVS